MEVNIVEFEVFHGRRRADAYRYASAIVGPEAAEDACQEAWLRAWRAWGSADDNRLDAWVFRIVRNCCIDHLRHAHHQPRALPVNPERAVDDAIADSVDAAASLTSLAALSPELREALWLREVLDLTYSDIAKVQGIPIGTVMSRLHTARRRALKLLGEHR